MRSALDTFGEQVGWRLLTVTRMEPLRPATVLRVWSSHPEIYPLNALKELGDPEWRALVAQRRPIVCNQPAELQAFFPADAERLQALGCGAGINVPVFEADTLLGTVNAFHQAGWYTPARVDLAQRLAADFFRNPT